MIRITNNMMVNDLRRNMNTNLRNMDIFQRQLSTTRRINQPSDDPAGIVRSLRLRTSLTEGEQYLQNTEESINYMDTMDSTMDTMGQILNRVRDLTVMAANGTNDPGSHDAIVKEIRQLHEQLGVIANTTYGSKYIFGGRNVTEAPYQGDLWLGNDDSLDIEISRGVKMAINLDIKDLFVGTEPYQKDVKLLDSSVIKALNCKNLQSGKYALRTEQTVGGSGGDAALSTNYSYFKNSAASSLFPTATVDLANPSTLANNASIELTVTGINSATGNVNYAYLSHEYNRDTGAYTTQRGEFTLGAGAQSVKIGSVDFNISGLTPGDLTIGDKTVLNVKAAHGTDYEQLDIIQDYTTKDGEVLGGGKSTGFIFKTGVLNKQTSDFHFLTVDSHGQTFDSSIIANIDTIKDADPAVYFQTKPGLFKLVAELADDIAKGDLPTISEKLGAIDLKIDELLLRRATLGAKVNRLEMHQNRLETTQTSYTALLSQNEDADMAEVIMNLKMQENVYRASLAAGARIIQPTLVDFLR